ncbi:hypothetical protein MHEC_01860 [Mycobacterium heckeshornense]|uniref:Uncharacterized protein n=1 Tax=Mycobacterium heckeshornense TaxID=110505 RepID=A0A7R7JFK5_9MYCO|nr:hypothetical protein MHEC_01860 [Mycobacterium heckeshornense]
MAISNREAIATFRQPTAALTRAARADGRKLAVQPKCQVPPIGANPCGQIP